MLFLEFLIFKVISSSFILNNALGTSISKDLYKNIYKNLNIYLLKQISLYHTFLIMSNHSYMNFRGIKYWQT